MTDDLSLLMRERAESADLPAPDLATIASAGRRRVLRRRGVAALIATTAAAVAVGGSVLAVDHASDSDGSRPATASEDGIAVTGLTWATGSTLHVGDRTHDLGHEVAAYVRTSVGYVFADPSGTVWSAHDGDVTEVGTVTEPTHLVSSADSPLAGWVDGSADRPRFVVLDQQSGDVAASPAASGTAGSTADDPSTTAEFEAIDGDTAYWRDAGGQSVVTVVPADGDTTMSLKPESGGGDEVLAVGSGVRVVSESQSGLVSIQLADGAAVTLEQVSASLGQLSPDAAYVNLDADAPAVYATDTGEPVHLDLDGFFADGYQWLDDHTLAVLALPTKTSDWQLLTCTVPDGACTVAVAHLGNPYANGKSAPGFTLPLGISLGDD